MSEQHAEALRIAQERMKHLRDDAPLISPMSIVCRALLASEERAAALHAENEALRKALLSGDALETRFTIVRDPQGIWLWRHDPLNGGGFRSERLLNLSTEESTS